MKKRVICIKCKSCCNSQVCTCGDRLHDYFLEKDSQEWFPRLDRFHHELIDRSHIDTHIDCGGFHDIYCGENYRAARAYFQSNRIDRYFTTINECDGVSPFRSSSFSIWPCLSIIRVWVWVCTHLCETQTLELSTLPLTKLHWQR